MIQSDLDDHFLTPQPYMYITVLDIISMRNAYISPTTSTYCDNCDTDTHDYDLYVPPHTHNLTYMYILHDNGIIVHTHYTSNTAATSHLIVVGSPSHRSVFKHTNTHTLYL
jgi:hypothetical protein